MFSAGRAFRQISRLNDDDGPPPAQMFLLRLLDRDGPLKISDQAKKIGVTPAAITNLTNSLVEKGYISRRRDPADRRVVWVQLEDKGREILSRARSRRREWLLGLVASLGPEDTSHLIRILGRIERILAADDDSIS